MIIIEWVKPNGLKVKTNDRQATIDHCASIGWVLADSVEKPETEEKPKRTRRTKAQIEADKAKENG